MSPCANASPALTDASPHLLLSPLQLLHQIFTFVGRKVPHADLFVPKPLFGDCHPQELHFNRMEQGMERGRRTEDKETE